MAPDEHLALLVADGDEEALRELLRRYQQPLAAFLYRHTGGGDVDDLYQETWLRVVRHARRFDASRRFSTWLFQIAVNLCRDWHRRRAPAAAEVEDDRVDPHGVAPVEAAHDAAALLASLPENQREVLILRYYHDLAEEEIATILECPRGTVKSRLHNALSRLTATMEKIE